MSKILATLERQNRARLALVSLLIVGLVTGVDFVTGYYLGFSIFYLIPIILLTWTGGLEIGLFTCFISAIGWFFVDITEHAPYPSLLVLLWNVGIGLGIFIIVSSAFWNVKLYRQRQRNLINFIVHDLRNPLISTMMSINLLKNKLADVMDDEMEHYLEIGLTSGKNMSMLIDCILDQERLQVRKMPLKLDKVAIQKVVADSLKEVSLLASRKQITLSGEYDWNVGQITTDLLLLKRLIINLTSNAIKVSPNNETVIVRVGSHDRWFCRVDIIDHGPGIPEKMAHKVFDMFTQAEKQKTGTNYGSGIGLSFCKVAVTALGGRIWLTSKEGEGTTVTFTLPITNHPTTETPSQST